MEDRVKAKEGGSERKEWRKSSKV